VRPPTLAFQHDVLLRARASVVDQRRSKNRTQSGRVILRELYTRMFALVRLLHSSAVISQSSAGKVPPTYSRSIVAITG
jgi:hypothetical protein